MAGLSIVGGMAKAANIEPNSGNTYPLRPWQLDVLRRLEVQNFVEASAEWGAGKSYLASLAAISFFTHNAPCKMVLAAPCWQEVKILQWEMKSQIKNLHIDRVWMHDNGMMTNNRPDSFIRFASLTDSPLHLSGFHSEHTMFICDNAEKMPARVIATVKPWAKKILLLRGIAKAGARR